MAVKDRGWFDWMALASGVAVCWFAIEAQQPPAAGPADARSGEFSSGRALSHVEAIARTPHPMGSPENERVRSVVVKTLEDLRLVPEVQTPRDKNSPLRNVLARLKGQGPPGKKAILLCAHYDSVPAGPGAGDDASGVAVILETLRALKAGQQLDRDVIALIDDGEERGLLGARLFVDEHPWAKEVGVVLNFDARGNSGPSFMFETSERNGWLIRQFAAACPHPLATSLSMDVYRILPNDTDLTIFKRAGIAGLNFAFGGGQADYHMPSDIPANLDPRTLQHQGENALAMCRHFGRLDLDDPRGDDVIYTSVLSRMVLFYPRTWALPIALGVAVVFLIVAGIGLVRQRVRVVDLAVGVVAWLVAALAAVFAAVAFWIVLRDILNGLGIPWMRIDVPILTACSVVAAAVFLLIERRVSRRRSAESLALGALTWWLILALASARWLPGSSYLFAWPTLFALLGLGGSFLMRAGSGTACIATLLGALPTLVPMSPLIRSTFDGLGLRMAGPLLILVALFLGAILPLLGPLLVTAGRRQTPVEPGPMPVGVVAGASQA